MSEKNLVIFDTREKESFLAMVVQDLQEIGEDGRRTFSVRENNRKKGLFTIYSGDRNYFARIVKNQLWVQNKENLPLIVELAIRKYIIYYHAWGENVNMHAVNEPYVKTFEVPDKRGITCYPD